MDLVYAELLGTPPPHTDPALPGSPRVLSKWLEQMASHYGVEEPRTMNAIVRKATILQCSFAALNEGVRPSFRPMHLRSACRTLSPRRRSNPVQQNLVINRTHINELLTAVNLVRAAAGWTAVTWSAILPAGIPAPPSAGQATVPIYAAHITSLRTQMDLALAALLIPRPPYTDALTTPTLIKAIHFTELQS